MTVGIYCLYFDTTDKVYIGQSTNIENRFKTHIDNILASKSNYKLNNMRHDLPSLAIIEKCQISQLDSKEVYWINKYDSYYNGFNCTLGGSGVDRDEVVSKYTRQELLDCFDYLSSGEVYSYKDIEKATGVPSRTLRDIAIGRIHVWLKEINTVLYKDMLANVSKRTKLSYISKTVRIKHKLFNPNKGIFIVENIREFALTHNLDRRHLNKLFKGEAISHKGWILAK